jgi:hypothetical protein
MSIKSQEKLLFQEVWKRAYDNPQGLTIRFKTEKLAYSARMALYNAIKEAKSGKEMLDKKLTLAAEHIRLIWGEDRTVLILQHRRDSEVVQTLEELLGVQMGELQNPEIVESLRLLETLSGRTDLVPKPEIGPLSTPPAQKPEGPLPSEFEHKDNKFYGKRG